jgi:hypothetical protein
MSKPNLKSIKIGKHWWVVGDDDYGPYGPYTNKQDADEDRRGVVKAIKHAGE